MYPVPLGGTSLPIFFTIPNPPEHEINVYIGLIRLELIPHSFKESVLAILL